MVASNPSTDAASGPKGKHGSGWQVALVVDTWIGDAYLLAPSVESLGAITPKGTRFFTAETLPALGPPVQVGTQMYLLDSFHSKGNSPVNA